MWFKLRNDAYLPHLSFYLRTRGYLKARVQVYHPTWNDQECFVETLPDD